MTREPPIRTDSPAGEKVSFVRRPTCPPFGGLLDGFPDLPADGPQNAGK